MKHIGIKHIGTDKEPNTAETNVMDEVWVRDESGHLVRQEADDDDVKEGQ